MNERNPGPAEPASRIARLLDAVDRLLFREPDLRATAQGWTVRRTRRFEREYRDPRWDLMVRCATCDAEGMIGSHACPDCGGRGRTLRHDDDRVARR